MSESSTVEQASSGRRQRTIPAYPFGPREGETSSQVRERYSRDGFDWHTEGLYDWSTEDIIETLNGLGIDVDVEHFRDIALRYETIDGLIADWMRGFPPNDLWQDFALMAAIPLWKRLAPDVLRHDLIADYIDVDLYDADLSDPQADRDAYIQKINRITEYFEALPSQERVDEYLAIVEESITDTINLFALAIEELGAEYPDDILRLANLLVEVDEEGAPSYVTSLTDSFEKIGRLEDVRPLLKQVLERDPDNCTYAALNFAAATGDEYGMVDYAVAWLDSMKSPSIWDVYYGEVTEQFTEHGHAELLDAVRSRAKRPADVYAQYEAIEHEKQEPVRVTHIGRNDPCPCGSGKKYKKCHGK